MNPYFPNLFNPMRIHNTIFRNRIIMAPTSLKELTDHNYLDYKTFDYLERRAMGGAAAITLGEGYVHETGCVEWSKKLHLYDPRSGVGLYNLATKVRSHGAICSVELNHAGMHFHDDNRINYGPSDRVDTFNQGDGNGDRTHVIHAMPPEIIESVIDGFGKCALRAKQCGCEAVLVHCGHGWLISQFLSPEINQRTDEWGGSLENRCRFGVEVVKRIRKYCGPNFVIECRVSWKEGTSEGFQLPDSTEFCQRLEAAGADMIHITAGSLHYHDTTPYTFPSWFDIAEGKNIDAAAEIKKHLHIPVGTVGSMTDPYTMDKWIGEGKIDYVVAARALISDPDMPKKAMFGRTDEIRPCLRCQACMTGGYYDLPHHCAVNPMVGRDGDYRFMLLPPDKKKKILIAGGGPAGMQAALTAAERGHEVILCEKSDHLGGLLPIIEKESFKVRIKMYREYMIRMVGRSNINVQLNTEVTPELIRKYAPDKVIAAIGATPINAPIPGIEKAINIVDYYTNEPEVGSQVIVIGGGFAGVECAIGLAEAGKKVTVIEMGDNIASGPNAPYPGTGAMQIDSLWLNANKNGVVIKLNTRCKELTEAGAVCSDKDGNTVVYSADTYISAGGMKPKFDEVAKLQDAVIDFAWVGDCYAPGLIRTAVEQGFNAAMND